MTATYPSVAIIVLNWNKWEITIECLESILQNDYPCYEIVLVDNGSKNDSVEKIMSYCQGELEVRSPFFRYDQRSKPLPFRSVLVGLDGEFTARSDDGYSAAAGPRMSLLRVEENQGFAGGNNLGIEFVAREVHPEYVLFMNNDVVVAPGFLSALVKDIRSSEKIAISAPKILYYDYNGASNIINCAGCFLDIRRVKSIRRGRGEPDRGQYDEGGEVDFADGACFLMKMSVLEVTGGFDRSFYTYWEETDLCTRIMALGYKCSYVPGSMVWHHESYSIIAASKEYYMVRNRYLFIRKNGSRWDSHRFMAYHLLVLFIPTILIHLHHQETERIGPFLRGTADGVKAVLITEDRGVHPGP
ncbi:MAG: glycosyltransferase family 2 protein [Methanomassiliicoccus sp.]|nr:glycosyltransferase family 2 protein [Methanomassiliicoccus sp.]